jgi:murein DD-endopeptidase MepM/ murein hydrolase activator NlpD
MTKTVLLALLLSTNGLAFELSGDFVQGGLLKGKADLATDIYVSDRKLLRDENGAFIIGLDRDAVSSLVVVEKAADEAVEHSFEISKRDYKLQKIEGISNKIMQPDPEAVARSVNESKLVKQARVKFSDSDGYKADFEWPLIGPITGVFGSQRVYNGVPKRPHYGVDVAAPTGTVAYAPAPGVITLAYDDMFFSGGTLIIDHGHGLTSSFLHLSKMLVQPGDRVEAGQAVAEVGATGRVTGPHLDWRMNWYNSRIDPQLLVGEMPKAQR